MSGGKEGGERNFTESVVVRAPGELQVDWGRELIRVVVDQNSGVPDAATLVFHDPNREMLSRTGIDIGSRVTLSLKTEGTAGGNLFTGEVTALELDYELDVTYTVVRALARTHRLTRNRRVQAFRNMTATAVARKVLSTAKLTPGKIDLRPITYPQISQAGETDWEFLTRLAAEHGATVRTDEQGQVEIGPPAKSSAAPSASASAKTSPLVLEYGDNLRSLRATLTSSGQVKTVRVRGWNIDTKTAMTASKPVAAGSMVAPGMTMSSALGKFAGLGATTELRTDRVYRTQAEVTAAADVLAGTISNGQAEFEAVVDGNPRLRADTPIALSGVDKKFAGKYTATSVQHVLEPEQPYRCIVGVSVDPDRSLAGLTGAGEPATAGPRISGVVTGVVTALGGTAKTDPRGVVKLKFPWLDDTYETDWVRTVQFGGVSGGGVFSPEVNDEVLVAFDQGLLDRPYVVGGLYNGKDKPGPHTGNLLLAGKVRRRSLAARAGHRLELIDGSITPGLLLSSDDDAMQIRINKTSRTLSLSVNRGGTSIELGPTGITLNAGTGALILRGQTVQLSGTTSVRIDGAMVSIN